MKITLIIGLPGSGKTTYAKGLDGYLVDDPKSLDELPDNFDGHLIITDPYLCIEGNLNLAVNILKDKYNTHNINYIYFENDPEQCIINSSKRVDKPVLGFINSLSKVYNPVKEFTITCWKD